MPVLRVYVTDVRIYAHRSLPHCKLHSRNVPMGYGNNHAQKSAHGYNPWVVMPTDTTTET